MIRTGPPLGAAFYARPVEAVARGLIGCWLLVAGVGGRIVETEAYDRHDPASHSFTGPTRRNQSMFGPPGHAYVYRSYGVHWCLNLVCGTTPGGAVLIRALEPLCGVATMQERRGAATHRDLCRGPGRLCQALAVSGALDGAPLDRLPFALTELAEPVELWAGTRIGITQAPGVEWRFGLARSPFLSRPIRPDPTRPGCDGGGGPARPV